MLRIASSGARRLLKMPPSISDRGAGALAAACVARPGAVFGEPARVTVCLPGEDFFRWVGRALSTAGPTGVCVAACWRAARRSRRRSITRPAWPRSASTKDAMFREAVDSPVPKADLDRFVPLAYYPIDDSVPHAGRARAVVGRRVAGLRDADVHRAAPADAQGRQAEVHGAWPDLHADRVRHRRGRGAPAPVRAVPRPHGRSRDLCVRGATSISIARPPACTTSISTPRISRTATTT